jgi:hypothetical protein
MTAAKSKRDIVALLRDPMIEVDYSDRLTAADEIERLRKAIRHDSGSLEDQPASPEHDDAGDVRA